MPGRLCIAAASLIATFGVIALFELVLAVSFAIAAGPRLSARSSVALAVTVVSAASAWTAAARTTLSCVAIIPSVSVTTVRLALVARRTTISLAVNFWAFGTDGSNIVTARLALSWWLWRLAFGCGRQGLAIGANDHRQQATSAYREGIVGYGRIDGGRLTDRY